MYSLVISVVIHCTSAKFITMSFTIAAGVGHQGDWDNKRDPSVWLGSRPAVGDTLTPTGKKFHL